MPHPARINKYKQKVKSAHEKEHLQRHLLLRRQSRLEIRPHHSKEIREYLT